MAEQCSNCYFKKDLCNPHNANLLCRRNPKPVWVRIDHWCGEYLPEDYFERLAERVDAE